jgi:hypothetical protein
VATFANRECLGLAILVRPELDGLERWFTAGVVTVLDIAVLDDLALLLRVGLGCCAPDRFVIGIGVGEPGLGVCGEGFAVRV